jgi:sodium/pantothenate symporter
VLCAGLFIPTIAGIWWKKTNTMGGVSALLVGVITYLIVQFNPDAPPLSAILFALPASLLGLLIGNRFGINVTDDIIEKVSKLHV